MMDQEKSILEQQLSAAEKEVEEVEARITQLESEIAAFDPATLPRKKMRLTAYRFIWAFSLPFLITALILLFTHDFSYYLTWVFYGIGMGLLIFGGFMVPRKFQKTCREMNVNGSIFSSVYTKVQNAINERQAELESLKQKGEELHLKIHEYEVRISLI